MALGKPFWTNLVLPGGILGCGGGMQVSALKLSSCWVWEEPVLADGTLGFCSHLAAIYHFLAGGCRWGGSSSWDSVPYCSLLLVLEALPCCLLSLAG